MYTLSFLIKHCEQEVDFWLILETCMDEITNCLHTENVFAENEMSSLLPSSGLQWIQKAKCTGSLGLVLQLSCTLKTCICTPIEKHLQKSGSLGQVCNAICNLSRGGCEMVGHPMFKSCSCGLTRSRTLCHLPDFLTWQQERQLEKAKARPCSSACTAAQPQSSTSLFADTAQTSGLWALHTQSLYRAG